MLAGLLEASFARNQSYPDVTAGPTVSMVWELVVAPCGKRLGFMSCHSSAFCLTWGSRMKDGSME